MKRVFKDLQTYIRLHDGMGKPKINFQELYKLFPGLTFTATKTFGSYTNFGGAFESKDYSMIVTDENGNVCLMVYKEYQDANENLAYVS